MFVGDWDTSSHSRRSCTNLIATISIFAGNPCLLTTDGKRRGIIKTTIKGAVTLNVYFSANLASCPPGEGIRGY